MKRTIALATVVLLFSNMSFAGPIRDAIAQQAQLQGQDWQKQYAAAKAEKNAGKKKMLIGAAATTVGIIVAATATDKCVNNIISGSNCTGSNSAATIGWIADLAGSGVLVQFIDGNGEMNRLNTHKPSDAGGIQLSPHTSVAVHAGSRTQVQYRVSW